LVFFGITSLPALILGFAARMMIADPYYNYKGEGMALGGIILAILGCIGWGLWFLSKM